MSTTASLPAGIDIARETVITGHVVDGAGRPIGGAAVRLLDASDEFAAEVIATPSGSFRFFAAPGSWRVRVASEAGSGDARVTPTAAGLHEIDVTVARVA